MRTMILMSAVTLAALAISAPAAAGGPDAWPGTSFHDGRGDGRHGSDGRDTRDHRRDGRGSVFVGPWGWGPDTWALYNNRSWESNSYNDWWHDRPDRAYPRWVQQNQNCTADRMWWSGTGWHC
jgi:hypothetical protein